MELHEYQKRAASFIDAHSNCILSVDMGLGKTASVLSWIAKTMPNTLCIVAPKRVAETVWLQEAQKWGWNAIADRMVIVKGTPAQRRKALADQSKPYKIVSRDGVREVAYRSFDVLVIDELTSFKNVESKRTQAVCHIVADCKIGLTGTFLANGAIDIFGQCAAVGIKCGYNFWAWRASFFRDRLAGSGLQFHKWVLRGTIDDVLRPIQDYIFTLTAADYLTIPPVTHNRHLVQLTEEERNAYDSLEAFLGFELGGDTLTVDEQAKFAKLQTLCNGFVYDAEGQAIRGTESAKLDAVADFVQECKDAGEPVLLFYAFRAELEWLSEKLTERGIKFTDVYEPGFLDKWNGGEIDCLLAHPASAGHGLNLQHGGRVIAWSSLTYNYEYFAQANARLARQGQTRNVQVHYFFADNTCESRIWNSLMKKQNEQNQFLNITKQ